MTSRAPVQSPPKPIAGRTHLAPPWDPTPFEPRELNAIKALKIGAATEDQQRTFVGWLVKATGLTELEFRPADERASCFAAGKRFVGLQFVTLAETVMISDP